MTGRNQPRTRPLPVARRHGRRARPERPPARDRPLAVRRCDVGLSRPMSISAQPFAPPSSSSAAAPRRSPSPGSPPSTKPGTIAVAVGPIGTDRRTSCSGIRPRQVARRLEVAERAAVAHTRCAAQSRPCRPACACEPRLGLARRRPARFRRRTPSAECRCGASPRRRRRSPAPANSSRHEVRRDEGGAGHEAEGERAGRRSAERAERTVEARR